MAQIAYIMAGRLQGESAGHSAIVTKTNVAIVACLIVAASAKSDATILARVSR